MSGEHYMSYMAYKFAHGKKRIVVPITEEEYAELLYFARRMGLRADVLAQMAVEHLLWSVRDGAVPMIEAAPIEELSRSHL